MKQDSPIESKAHTPQDPLNCSPGGVQLGKETHLSQKEELIGLEVGQQLEKQEEGSQNNEEDLMQMQRDYQKLFLKKEKKEPVQVPAEKHPENKLIVLGTSKGRLLCELRSVNLEPSQSSKDNQKKANKNEQKGVSGAASTRYWQKRYYLFQKYDEGIQLDEQSWYSVTPEAVANYVASKIGGKDKVVLDGFCGAGGDSIQLALNCKEVISNDLDAQKIKLLKGNAAIYKAENITTSNLSFMDLQLQKGQVDVIYMSPPWGGPQYFELSSIRPQDMQPPLDTILTKAFTMTDNIALLLSANMDIEALTESFAETLAPHHTSTCAVVIQKIYFLGRLKFLLVLFGKDTAQVNLGDELFFIYRIIAEGSTRFTHRAVVKRLRQKLGMVKLLNNLFECQNYLWKDKATLYSKLEAHLLHNDLIGKEELLKLNQQDDAVIPPSKRAAKNRKKRKKIQQPLNQIREGSDSEQSDADAGDEIAPSKARELDKPGND